MSVGNKLHFFRTFNTTKELVLHVLSDWKKYRIAYTSHGFNFQFFVFTDFQRNLAHSKQ